MRNSAILTGALSLVLVVLIVNLSLGSSNISFADIVGALVAFDQDNYDHFVIVYQRVPRALLAIFIGAVMACSGAVLQEITRNPLASPAVLGVNSGATMFVVAGALFLGIPEEWHGVSAIAGGFFGFACCFIVARLIGLSQDPRGLALILSGAVMSMLFVSIANALLLAQPSMRTFFLGWISGNINHAYADRLYDFWWIGAMALLGLFLMARPLTLIALGDEKAKSIGLNVSLVRMMAILSVVTASSIAVAICGPVGFLGLVVPHMVRPLVGASLVVGLPTNALFGAAVCLLADIVARIAFSPFVLHTGVILDLIGGIFFGVIVKRFYLSKSVKGAA